MHYKKVPRFQGEQGPPGGSALRLHRLSKEQTAGGLDLRPGDVGRHSFLRNSRRAVLAVNGSLRRAKQRRALDRCGPLGTPFRYEGMGFCGMVGYNRSGLGQARRTGKFPKSGLKMVNPFDDSQSPERVPRMAP